VVTLTEAQILRMPKKAYENSDTMNKEMKVFFKALLLKQQRETEEDLAAARERLARGNEPGTDEGEQASSAESLTIDLRIVERKSKLLQKIRSSLQQIEDGSYGYCKETGEPIGVKRLLLRPTATLSIMAKTFQEEKERDYSD